MNMQRTQIFVKDRNQWLLFFPEDISYQNARNSSPPAMRRLGNACFTRLRPSGRAELARATGRADDRLNLGACSGHRSNLNAFTNTEADRRGHMSFMEFTEAEFAF